VEKFAKSGGRMLLGCEGPRAKLLGDTYTGSHLVREVLKRGEGCRSHALLTSISYTRGTSRYRHVEYYWVLLASNKWIEYKVASCLQD
jgi:hypothetical protein